MSHQAIAAAYDALAETWLDDRFPADNGIAQHRKALSFLATRGGVALNVGCGCNTRILRLLRDNGLSPEGIDISSRMVMLARAADPATPIHLADICDWPMPTRYRLICAWDSIWHVALEKQRALFQKLLLALAPGGVLLFTAGDLDHPSEHADACMGPELYYATLGIPALMQVIHDCGAVLRHFEFDQQPAQHLVVIAQGPD